MFFPLIDSPLKSKPKRRKNKKSNTTTIATTTRRRSNWQKERINECGLEYATSHISLDYFQPLIYFGCRVTDGHAIPLLPPPASSRLLPPPPRRGRRLLRPPRIDEWETERRRRRRRKAVEEPLKTEFENGARCASNYDNWFPSPRKTICVFLFTAEGRRMEEEAKWEPRSIDLFIWRGGEGADVPSMHPSIGGGGGGGRGGRRRSQHHPKATEQNRKCTLKPPRQPLEPDMNHFLRFRPLLIHSSCWVSSAGRPGRPGRSGHGRDGGRGAVSMTARAI